MNVLFYSADPFGESDAKSSSEAEVRVDGARTRTGLVPTQPRARKQTRTSDAQVVVRADSYLKPGPLIDHHSRALVLHNEALLALTPVRTARLTSAPVY